MARSPPMAFEPDYVKTFMGGTFTIEGKVESAPELARQLREWLKEVEGWKDAPIADVSIVKGRMTVLLKDGIL